MSAVPVLAVPPMHRTSSRLRQLFLPPSRNNLITAFAPEITPPVQNPTPDLAQQLIVAFDPSFSIDTEYSIEQASFRFRRDDGSEAAATWIHPATRTSSLACVTRRSVSGSYPSTRNQAASTCLLPPTSGYKRT